MFTAALSTIAKTWKQHGMDKEDVVYIYIHNGILLLSYKKRIK